MMWERSPKQYEKYYINGEKFPVNQYMRLGKRVAEALENDTPVKDGFIEQFRVLTPAYKNREYEIVAEGEFTLLGKIDGCTFGKKSIMGEHKTGKNWTQKMADNHVQITFYNMLLYLTKKKLFDENYLHWAETHLDDNGIVELTGNITTFSTTRNVKDVLKLYSSCKKAVIEIDKRMNELCTTANSQTK